MISIEHKLQSASQYNKITQVLDSTTNNPSQILEMLIPQYNNTSLKQYHTQPRSDPKKCLYTEQTRSYKVLPAAVTNFTRTWSMRHKELGTLIQFNIRRSHFLEDNYFLNPFVL